MGGAYSVAKCKAQSNTMAVPYKGASRPARLQGLVLNLLRSHESLSVSEMSKLLGLADPRGHIAELRHKGYDIGDYWVKSEYGSRYKRYYLKQ